MPFNTISTSITSYLATTANLTVTNIGTVSTNGVTLTGSGDVLLNQNKIKNTTGNGVFFGANALLTNSGYVYGRSSGVLQQGTSGTVINSGTINGNQRGAIGIDGFVLNQSSGLIESFHRYGVSGNGTVINFGTISAGVDGVMLGSPTIAAYLSNAAGGYILGRLGNGVALYTGLALNDGTIKGDNGFGLSRGATIINNAGATIAAIGFNGVDVSAGGTVINAGLIMGPSSPSPAQPDYAVKFQSGYNNRLVVDPGATFTSTVSGGYTAASTASSVLEFATGSAAGTLAGLGTKYIGFNAITIDPGASWTLSGDNTIGAGVSLIATSATLTSDGTIWNDGLIVLDPSRITMAGLNGTGSVSIGAESTLAVTGTIGSGETLVLGGASAGLILPSPTSDAGTIEGFATGQMIDLGGVVPASVHYGSGYIYFSLTAGGTGSIVAHGAAAVSAQPDGVGGALVIPLCFLRGTLIRTPRGDRPVEDLQISDPVLTWGNATRRIVWIGQGNSMARRGQRDAATPVIVRRHAFARDVPNRDLHVTKGHSFLIDNVLIPVEFLINHRSILWDDHAQTVQLFHIELETHDVLIANGAPAESYRDDGNRWLFQNANTGWALAPRPPCAPVLTGGPVVDAAWRRLLDQAGPRPGLPLTEDADVHLFCDGVRIDPVRAFQTTLSFRLATMPHSLRLRSRASVPAELGLARDPRLLGIGVQSLAIWQGAQVRCVDPADPMLADGFHPPEPGLDYRWTNGDAAIPSGLLDAFSAGFALDVRIAGKTSYRLGPYSAAA